MKIIDVDKVIEALRQAVAERGESFSYHDHYHTTSCQYVEVTEDGAEAACIAGNALRKLGVPIDTLMSMDRTASGQTSATVDSHAVALILQRAGFELTNTAGEILRTAQITQDSSRVWGEALHNAEHQANLYAPAQ